MRKKSHNLRNQKLIQIVINLLHSQSQSPSQYSLQHFLAIITGNKFNGKSKQIEGQQQEKNIFDVGFAFGKCD